MSRLLLANYNTVLKKNSHLILTLKFCIFLKYLLSIIMTCLPFIYILLVFETQSKDSPRILIAKIHYFFIIKLIIQLKHLQ